MKLSGPGAGTAFPPLLLLLALSPAHAGDDSGAWQREDRSIETVQVTATRTKAAAQDVSVAITAVGQDRVRSDSPDVLPEMLRGLPGTYFQQTTPGQGIPIIRGLKGSQVLHLVDGMRINNAFFRDAPNQYLGLVDPFAVQGIEVVRGSSGSLYGADAMGGVVNFLTPEAAFDGDAWQFEHRLHGSWNSADDGLAFRAETRAGKDGHGLSAGVSWQDHSDRETGGGRTVYATAYRSEAANFKWTAQIGDRADLMLSTQLLEQPSTPRSDELMPGFGQQQPSSEQFEFRPNRRSFVHARYRSQSRRAWLDGFQLNIARQVITDDRLTQDFGVPLVTMEDNTSTLDGLTLQFDRETRSGMHLTWGLDYYADEVDSSRRQTDLQGGGTTVVASRFPHGSSMDSAAAYLSAEWRPAQRWKLGGGLRYSATDLDLPAGPNNPAVSLSPGDVTGDLRFVYALGPQTNLVGNLGRGFRPPNIFDLGTLGNRPGNRFNIANPDLQPENVWSYDLGLKLRTGRLQAELFVFYLDYRDKISSVATGDVTETGRTVVRSENLAESKLYGMESGIRWFSASGHEIYGTLNYTRGEERTRDGLFPADRIPPLNGKLGMSIFFSEKLRIEPYLLFAGRQDRLSARDMDDPRINPAGTPGWVTWNVALAWNAGKRTQIGLRLENLADKPYREHGSGIDAPGLNIGAWASLEF